MMTQREVAKVLDIAQKNICETEQRAYKRFQENWIYYSVLRRAGLSEQETLTLLSAERLGVLDRKFRGRLREMIEPHIIDTDRGPE